MGGSGDAQPICIYVNGYGEIYHVEKKENISSCLNISVNIFCPWGDALCSSKCPWRQHKTKMEEHEDESESGNSECEKISNQP